MRAITYLAAVTCGMATLSTSAFAETPKGWETDVAAAMEKAKEEDKSVMLEFTGSDWCPPCIMMKKKVFSKEEFVEKASEDFILVHLDFPKGDPKLAEKNQVYAEEHMIDSFPTIVLLDSEGKEYSRFIASEFPEVDSFLAHLEQAQERKDMD